MPEDKKHWFVARTRSKQEFAVRDCIEALKTKHHLDVVCYLPTHTEVRLLKYRRRSVVVPVIRHLIFIYATKQTACELHNLYGVHISYMLDLFTRAMLIVPPRQMEYFKFVMDLDPDGVSFSNEHLTVGHHVQVVKGEFTGIEGEIATSANQETYVVIRLKDVLTASVKVPRSYLKRVGESN
jgi:transcription antitermination factor NusG